MKRSGKCPKCQSRSILTGGDGPKHLDLGGVYEYTTFVCGSCGLEERYMNDKVIEYRLSVEQLEWVNPPSEGPFR
ncbi:MAG: hypothetical protein KJO07_05420 [Deltaproteobacteria bacterium]|nr:hypothetical protein [Deltaproteobacteria bacterium]